MRFRPLLLALVLAATATLGCGSAEEMAETHGPLPDGFYLLATENPADAPTEVPRTIPYRHDFLDDTQGEPDSLVVVPAEHVVLELDEEPEGVEQPDGRLMLLLSMSQVGSEQLADFTEKHLNRSAAIVIGGQAVTHHKIRARIEGGQLQVTRCDDDACRKLLVELEDNVKKPQAPTN